MPTQPSAVPADKPTAPRIGALFNHGGRAYRVTGWICPSTPPKLSEEDEEIGVLADLIRELRGDQPSETRFKWCSQAEATHVTGAGICGCRAAINEIEVTGMVTWPEDRIAADQASAERRATLGMLL